MAAFEQNRLGQLDPAQVPTLWRAAAAKVVFAVVLVCLASMVLFWVSSLADFLCYGWLFVLIGLGSLMYLQEAYVLVVEARAGRVDAVHSLAATRIVQSRGMSLPPAHYHIDIAGESFDISHQTYRALVAGRHYQVYFTPRSRTLVGIEPLTKSQSDRK